MSLLGIEPAAPRILDRQPFQLDSDLVHGRCPRCESQMSLDPSSLNRHVFHDCPLDRFPDAPRFEFVVVAGHHCDCCENVTTHIDYCDECLTYICEDCDHKLTEGDGCYCPQKCLGE